MTHTVFSDPSMAIAVSSLLRGVEPGWTMTVAELAVPFREDYLAVHRSLTGDVIQSGTLSVEDAKQYLRNVLLRLMAEGLVHGTEPLDDDSAIAVTEMVVAELDEDIGAYCEGLLRTAHDLLRQAEAIPEPAAGGNGSGLSELVATGLVKSYKGVRVVNGVNITLRQGEIVGLLGPNGAGKTTTFYMIVGLVRPDDGEIILDGHKIRKLPMYRRARRGIGYLAQEPSIFRKLTVEQNILAILETLKLSRKERFARLEELLNELGIKQHRHKKAYKLSGGERRRLEITRALVTQPKFMLLDEPFAGVDPIAVHDIQTIVANLRRRGIGVLITDHNVEQTLDIVDRAYIMFEGQVEVSGTVEELVMDDQVAESYLGPTLTARLRERLGKTA